MNSFLLYSGPAARPYRGDVTVVVFLSESNPKTGPCIAVAILPGDGRDAAQARARGEDLSACGSCTLRSLASGGKGGCYVSGPALMGYAGSASAAWRRADPFAMPEAPAGLPMRLGAYGDPAAVPSEVLARLESWHDGMAWGYTHGWRHSAAQHLRASCMASCETNADTIEARAKGWRVYQIVSAAPGAVEASGLAECESAQGVACSDCGACAGDAARADAGRAIVVHGPSVKKASAVLAARASAPVRALSLAAV